MHTINRRKCDRRWLDRTDDRLIGDRGRILQETFLANLRPDHPTIANRNISRKTLRTAFP